MDPILLLPEEEKILSMSWYKVLKWTVKPKSPLGGLSRKSGPHVAEPSTGPIPIKPKSAIKGFTLLKNIAIFFILIPVIPSRYTPDTMGKNNSKHFKKLKAHLHRYYIF